MLVRQLDSHARVLLVICLCLGFILLAIVHSKSDTLLPLQLRQKGLSNTLQNGTNDNDSLLRDVSNSTLGVSVQVCSKLVSLAEQAPVPENVCAWATLKDRSSRLDVAGCCVQRVRY